MATDTDCVFCRIAKATLPANIVFEDDAIVAFLDVTPLSDGHLLLIPRDHVERITDMPDELAARLGAAMPRLGRALLTVTAAPGFNVLQNNGREAGQVVPHVHFHLIPRAAADGLGYRWNAGTYAEGRDIELAEALRRALT
ncbi:MAG: HIT family protein [Phycisphaerae bacterium]